MSNAIVPSEIISTIFYIRGKKAMLDYHLAALYEIETRVLNQAVRRNTNRFPSDFMFELTDEEYQNLISQNVISSWGGRRKPPLAFTEQGVAMLSGILKSNKAIQVNIAIMRTFVKLREMMIENKELQSKIEEFEKKYDNKFLIVFEAIKQLVDKKNQPRKVIGYKVQNKD